MIQLGITERKTEQKIGDNMRYHPQQMVEIVSSKDGVARNIEFKKGVPRKVSGLLAEAIVRDSRGIIKPYNEEEEKAVSEYEQMKADLEALKKKESDKTDSPQKTESKKSKNKKE